MNFSSYLDLLALHRIILEAKFCGSPSDPAVALSPRTATIANQVVDSIVGVLESENRGAEAEEWRAWRMGLSGRDREFGVVKSLLEKILDEWAGYSYEEKVEAIRDFAAPFVPSDKEIEGLIEYADSGGSL